MISRVKSGDVGLSLSGRRDYVGQAKSQAVETCRMRKQQLLSFSPCNREWEMRAQYSRQKSTVKGRGCVKERRVEGGSDVESPRPREAWTDRSSGITTAQGWSLHFSSSPRIHLNSLALDASRSSVSRLSSLRSLPTTCPPAFSPALYARPWPPLRAPHPSEASNPALQRWLMLLLSEDPLAASEEGEFSPVAIGSARSLFLHPKRSSASR